MNDFEYDEAKDRGIELAFDRMDDLVNEILDKPNGTTVRFDEFYFNYTKLKRQLMKE